MTNNPSHGVPLAGQPQITEADINAEIKYLSKQLEFLETKIGALKAIQVQCEFEWRSADPEDAAPAPENQDNHQPMPDEVKQSPEEILVGGEIADVLGPDTAFAISDYLGACVGEMDLNMEMIQARLEMLEAAKRQLAGRIIGVTLNPRRV